MLAPPGKRSSIHTLRQVIGLVAALTAALATALSAVPAPASGAARPAVGLRLVAQGLTSPVNLVPAPDGSGRLFVVDQAGLLRVLRGDGTLAPDPFLDVRDRMVALRAGFDERGLLGLAFHPGYARNGRFFVFYNRPLRPGGPAGFDDTVTVSEFRVSAGDPDRADPGSERVLLQVDKPQFNHNGGTLLFGPDGFLYIAIGDGGGAHDIGLGHVEDWFPDNAGGNGQDVEQNLLGNILRIDVDAAEAGRPYGIPDDNPFAGGPGLDEIYAYGFRNPFRMSFDTRGRRQLIVGDVGQGNWEEVDVVTNGGNFGWNVREGTHCFDAENPPVEPASCPAVDPEGDPLIRPVVEYANSARPGGIGIAVIGGHIYRGRDLPGFQGRYIFGDWSRSGNAADGTLLLATPRPRGQWGLRELAVAGAPNGRIGRFVLGFGQDRSGEEYVLTTANRGPTGTTGTVHRLVRAS